MQITNENFSLKDQFLVFLLLLLSGSPIISNVGKLSYALSIFIVLIIIQGKIKEKKLFKKFLLQILFAIAVIFFCQKIILGFLSILGALNYMSKIVLGAVIINHLNNRFPEIFFKVLTKLSLISLFGFLFFNFLGMGMPGISSGNHTSLIFFATTTDHPTRNEGMFWEPGAFGGMITLCLALNFNNIQQYLRTKKISLLIILLALLTTQSTTTYIVCFLLLAFNFLLKANKILVLILLPFVIISTSYIYFSTDFLSEKITHQLEDASENTHTSNQEFSNTRFGSFLFDLHYIQKHPIIGNGLSEETRYADHPFLISEIKQGENLGNGNGFSNYLACMGIPFVLMFFILTYTAVRKNNNAISSAIIIIAIFFILQGEQWLGAAIFLGLPFLYLKGKTTELKPIDLADEEISTELTAPIHTSVF